MFTRRLIDRTGRLLVAAAVADGRRATLEWCRDALFLSMADELERRGISRKVAADMLGLTRRTYNRQLNAAAESSVNADTLSLRIFRRLSKKPAQRQEIAAEFTWVPERTLGSILRDLLDNDWVREADDGHLEAVQRGDAWTDAELDDYLRLLSAFRDRFTAEELSQELGVPLERVAPLWELTVPQWVDEVTPSQVWGAMTRVVDLAYEWIRLYLGKARDHQRGGVWSLDLRRGDLARVRALREHARVVRDDLHDFAHSHAREDDDNEETIGAWSLLVLEAIDLDPDDPRLSE